MVPPKKLTNVTDGNELEFVSIIKQKTVLLYEYIYTKSENKKGMKLPLTETDLNYYLNNKIFI